MSQIKTTSSNTCEEASPFSLNKYLPCGNKAVVVVYSERDNREYAMCAKCAFHNINSRGMKEVRKIN